MRKVLILAISVMFISLNLFPMEIFKDFIVAFAKNHPVESLVGGVSVIGLVTQKSYDSYENYKERKKLKKKFPQADLNLINCYQGSFFKLVDSVFEYNKKKPLNKNPLFEELAKSLKSINYNLSLFPDRTAVEKFLEDAFYKLLPVIFLALENKKYENNTSKSIKKENLSKNEEKFDLLKKFFLGMHDDFYSCLSSHTWSFIGWFNFYHSEVSYLKKIFADNMSQNNSQEVALRLIQTNTGSIGLKQFYGGQGLVYDIFDIEKAYGKNINIVGKQFDEYWDQIDGQFKAIDFLTKLDYSIHIPQPMAIFEGKPGIGKTYFTKILFKKILDKKIFNSMYSLLITVCSADIITKWVGESEKELTNLFNKIKNIASEAQKNNGVIVLCMDEIDSLIANREETGVKEWTIKLTNTFLNQIDTLRLAGLPILVFGTTNNGERIDSAAKRAGRLMIYTIESPSDEEKKNIVSMYHEKYCDEKFEKFLTEKEIDELCLLNTGAQISENIKNIFLKKLDNYISDNPNYEIKDLSNEKIDLLKKNEMIREEENKEKQ